MPEDFRVANLFIFYVAMLLYFCVGAITTLGQGWYHTLAVPEWMFNDYVVAVTWSVLFISTALSARCFWDSASRNRGFGTTLWIYLGNGLLVLLWNYLFFGLHALALAFLAAIAVALSLLALVIRTRSQARKAAAYLVPYLLWMVFALYFSYSIIGLNA